jgi:uncharacterized protein (TIRG00374 family)
MSGMLKKSKNMIIQILKVGFSAGIIFLLIKSDKLNFNVLKNLLHPTYAVAGLTLVFIGSFLFSERWRMLIKSQGINAGMWGTFKLSMIGAFFNFAMPGGIGGDIVKAYYFTRDFPGTKVVAVTSVLMDRVLGLFAMILMAMVVMFYDLDHIMKMPVLWTLFLVISSLFLGFSVALALIFSKGLYDNGTLKRILDKLPLSAKTIKLYESMHLYGNHGGRVLATVILSLVGQCSTILFMAMVGSAAGYGDVSLKTYFLVAPLGFMATAVPISPAGVGVGQAAFYFLFNLYLGSSTELGPTVITAFQVTTFLVSLSGALFYLQKKERINPQQLEEIT